MAFDYMALLSDPNFLQQMGRTGSMISSGASAGEALNPADMIRQTQSQQATQQLLNQILGGQDPNKVASPLNSPGLQTQGIPTGQVQSYQPQQADPLSALKGIVPTPKGQAGADQVTTVTNADGTTHTVKVPSENNLNTYVTNVPLEAQSKGGGLGSNFSPFFQTLLG